MIRLPILTRFVVKNYGLFPGKPEKPGVEWELRRGVSLIAGINGLGKTTMLMMFLRSFTGPFDLTGEGVPDRFDVVLPPNPVQLNNKALHFFVQRVADGAANATVKIAAQFGDDTIEIRRRLSDLNLLDLTMNGKKRDLPSRKTERESSFQEILCLLFGLSSFVDVLLILHHIVFFTEDRLGALWDENAQRQILRAVFLEKTAALEVADFERKVNGADSRARNLRARAFNIDEELKEARRREAVSPKLKAQLAAEQKLLEADLQRRQALEATLGELDEGRKAVRLEHEKAKLQREEADSAVDRLKYAALLSLFPTMEDAARYTVLKILTTGECLVCGADASKQREELETLLASGYCPACGAEPERQVRIGAPQNIQATQVKRARTRATLARAEEESTRKALADLVSEYDQVLNSITEVGKTIEDRMRREHRLSAELPVTSVTILDLQRALETTRRQQYEQEAVRANAARELRGVLKQGHARIVSQARRLSARFRRHVGALLAGKARLVQIEGTAKLIMGKNDFTVPAFLPEMSAANRPGQTRRSLISDVSESERELIDLAFRLSLVDVATTREVCSLIMETPEASLDELAMQRVGSALHRFAGKGENRLIVTSNLTNSGMITAMFGGPTTSKTEIRRREQQVLNLLEIAAPNQALEKDSGEYANILCSAISGQPDHGSRS
jgi:hypothetical protein